MSCTLLELTAPQWNKERLSAAYFANPEKTLKEVGMGSLSLEVPPPPRPETFKVRLY
jgi:hypothetical protein